MRDVIRLVVVAAVLGVAAWYGWQRLFPDDEAEIQAVLSRIAEGVGGGASESPTGRLARAASLRREFDADVTVDAGSPFPRLEGRDAIIGTAARLSESIRNLDITFDDVTISVDSARQSATANLTAEARFDDATGARAFDARELDVAFTRIDGAWVVSTVTLVRTLRRLDPS